MLPDGAMIRFSLEIPLSCTIVRRDQELVECGKMAEVGSEIGNRWSEERARRGGGTAGGKGGGK